MDGWTYSVWKIFRARPGWRAVARQSDQAGHNYLWGSDKATSPVQAVTSELNLIVGASANVDQLAIESFETRSRDLCRKSEP